MKKMENYGRSSIGRNNENNKQAIGKKMKNPKGKKPKPPQNGLAPSRTTFDPFSLDDGIVLF
jgi:hypothetical protein